MRPSHAAHPLSVHVRFGVERRVRMFADSSAGADHPLENLEAAGEPPAIPAASGRVCFEPLTVEQADGVVATPGAAGFCRHIRGVAAAPASKRSEWSAGRYCSVVIWNRTCHRTLPDSS
jgi:hypothetical protein